MIASSWFTPKMKSTRDKKSKESHHSRSHKCRRSGGHVDFIEPLYFLDPMLSHSNNVPLFFQTPYYSPPQPNGLPPVGYINPPNPLVYPSMSHPPQLKIGPLYLLPDGRITNEAPVIQDGLQPTYINKNTPTQKDKPVPKPVSVSNEKPSTANVLGNSYFLPRQSEACDVINKWKSQDCSKTNSINTLCQYGVSPPSRMTSMPNIADRNFTNIHGNELSNHVAEKENTETISPKDPRFTVRGDLTIMRVSDRKDILKDKRLYDQFYPSTSQYLRPNQSEAPKQQNMRRWSLPGYDNNRDNFRQSCNELPIRMDDLNSDRNEINHDERFNNYPHTNQYLRPSTISSPSEELKQASIRRWNHQVYQNNGENPRQSYNEVPIRMEDLNRENEFRSSNNFSYQHDPQQMNIGTVNDKPWNCDSYVCSRGNGDHRTSRNMTTEDSINDLYRKINDIQSSLGASQDLMLRRTEQEMRHMTYSVPSEQSVYSRQVPYYDSEKAPSTSTVTRGVSPIVFRKVESTESCRCSCFHQTGFEVERDLNSPDPTHSIDNLTGFSSSPAPCIYNNNYHYNNGPPNDRMVFGKVNYIQTNTPFQPDVDVCVESLPQRNDNVTIIIDQEAQCQSTPSFSQNMQDACSQPIQEICNRPCNCSQNTPPTSFNNTLLCCDPNEIIPNRIPAVKLCALIPSDLPICSDPNENQHCSTKDTSTMCSSTDLPPSSEIQLHCCSKNEKGGERTNSVQPSNVVSVSQNYIEQTKPCHCPPNPPISCECDFGKELNNIMEKVEDNIMLKLEKNKLIPRDRTSNTESVSETRKPRLSNKSQNTDLEHEHLRTIPTKLEISSFISASRKVFESQNNPVKENEFEIRERPIARDRSTSTSASLGMESEPDEEPPVTLLDKGTDRYSSATPRRTSRGPSVFSTITSRRRSLPSSLRNSRFSSRRSSSGNPSHKSAATQVLTVIPSIRNIFERSKNKIGVTKDDELSCMYIKSNKRSMGGTKLKKNKKGRKNNSSYQIRRIKLSRPKRHIYILVKKRDEEKNVSSHESQETSNISTIPSANCLRAISPKINFFAKEKRKINHLFIKPNKDTRDKSKFTL